MSGAIPLVDLEAFSGPMDLLLYLIRQEEVEVTDIPIARICDRFLEELPRIEKLDLEAAGDFLVMASTLMLIKSRMLLPSNEPDEDEEWEDPRLELVEQLLEYRRVRGAADLLVEMRGQASRRYERDVPDLEELEVEAKEADLPLADVSVGDLYGAFQKLMQEVSLRRPRTIVYDETPIHIHAATLLDRLKSEGPMTFVDLLGGRDADRAVLIGSFLALLELVRQKRVAAEQPETFGEILLRRIEPDGADDRNPSSHGSPAGFAEVPPSPDPLDDPEGPG